MKEYASYNDIFCNDIFMLLKSSSGALNVRDHLAYEGCDLDPIQDSVSSLVPNSAGPWKIALIPPQELKKGRWGAIRDVAERVEEEGKR